MSSEASAEPGQWRTSRAEYQRGIMDALSDASVESVVLMSISQTGKGEALSNSVGYYIGQDPAPIMVVMPTERDAEAWSKDRFSPMARDTPCLAGRIADPKSRDGSNKILHKRFPGGHLTIVGANAPSGLASRPIRILLCDEVDRYPVSAGAEGDPVNLAKKRTVTFWNRKIVLVSTPTIRGASRIETSCGGIELELLSSEAPFTANNFAFLATRGFYDATVIHRVVPGFVVQMGDPTGTGTGGPGYRFADELDAARTRGYARGTVAMANAGPDTNGSQFFVCLDDVALPPQYAVFGQVTGGMEVVDAIAALPLEGETPAQTCFVERVKVAPYVMIDGRLGRNDHHEHGGVGVLEEILDAVPEEGLPAGEPGPRAPADEIGM
jgi:cyclophilin family peptidyl-prolyl cis-trans isomerase